MCARSLAFEVGERVKLDTTFSKATRVMSEKAYPGEFRFRIFFLKRSTASIASSSELLGTACDVESFSYEGNTVLNVLSVDLRFLRFCCCDTNCVDCDAMEFSDIETRASLEPDACCQENKCFCQKIC